MMMVVLVMMDDGDNADDGDGGCNVATMTVSANGNDGDDCNHL